MRPQFTDTVSARTDVNCLAEFNPERYIDVSIDKVEGSSSHRAPIAQVDRAVVS